MKPPALLLSLLVLTLSANQSFAAWAVAQGATGNPTFGFGYYALAEAKAHALRLCTQDGFKSCKIVETGYTDCLATANSTDKANSHWGIGKAPTKAAADKLALAKCDGRHGKCVITYDHCGR